MNIRIPLLSCAAVLSLGLAGCATTPGNSGYYGGGSGYGANCYDCGTVIRIDQVGGQPTRGVTGAVIGGLVGAGALGYDVVLGFARSEEWGFGAAAGISIVLLGVMVDRIAR